jgi:hypothetical protein
MIVGKLVSNHIKNVIYVRKVLVFVLKSGGSLYNIDISKKYVAPTTLYKF